MADHYLQVTIGGEVQTTSISRCEIRKAFGLHSVVVVDLRVATAFGAGFHVWEEWTPARIDFGRRFDTVAPWFGYVHHSSVTADTKALKGTVLQYVLIGTSLPMNEQRTRSWQASTASSIARQIFREHGLRTITSVHPRILSYWAQPGISDFALLQGLAEETGYRVYIDGPTGQFFNPRTLLSGPLTGPVPYYQQDRGRTANSTLLLFQSLTGRMIPRPAGEHKQAVVYGVDKRSQRLVHATATAQPQHTVARTKTVNDFAVAQLLADATTLATQGWISARLDIRGNASINPGSLVDLGGTGLSTENSGRWLVRGATHIFDIYKTRNKDMFMSTLEVERDQSHSATFDHVASLTNTTDASLSTLDPDDLWVAQYLEDLRVS